MSMTLERLEELRTQSMKWGVFSVVGVTFREIADLAEAKLREDGAKTEWEPGIECEHGYDACPICDKRSPTPDAPVMMSREEIERASLYITPASHERLCTTALAYHDKVEEAKATKCPAGTTCAHHSRLQSKYDKLCNAHDARFCELRAAKGKNASLKATLAEAMERLESLTDDIEAFYDIRDMPERCRYASFKGALAFIDKHKEGEG